MASTATPYLARYPFSFATLTFSMSPPPTTRIVCSLVSCPKPTIAVASAAAPIETKAKRVAFLNAANSRPVINVPIKETESVDESAVVSRSPYVLVDPAFEDLNDVETVLLKHHHMAVA